MSAWIVSKEHIDYLVTQWLRGDASMYVGGGWEKFGPEDADDVGRDLWTANLESVAFRYPGDRSGDRPGAGHSDEEIENYRHTTIYRLKGVSPGPFTLLKAVNCYRYQSCEHPGWKGSRADQLSNAIREKAIHLIGDESEEYQRAPWGIDSRHVA